MKFRSKSPSCTIGNSPRITFLTVTFKSPGPGKYNQDNTAVKTRGPTFKIGMKLSPKRDSYNPGPGAYNSDLDNSFTSKSSDSKSFKFGNSKR